MGPFAADGMLPVNVSGGSLGCGYTHDLTGLAQCLGGGDATPWSSRKYAIRQR